MSETVKGIEGVWVKDTKAVVSNAKVTEWRVTLAVTFIVGRMGQPAAHSSPGGAN